MHIDNNIMCLMRDFFLFLSLNFCHNKACLFLQLKNRV